MLIITTSGGLLLLEHELNNLKKLSKQVVVIAKIKSVVVESGRGHCQRCGSFFKSHAFSLDKSVSYCPWCLQLGRCQNNNYLYLVTVQELRVTKSASYLEWSGKLSRHQLKASQKIVASLQNKKSLLVHGVTGSGKTEMLFQGLDFALTQGMTIGIVAPRIDVCLELYPRLQAAFPLVPMSLLYGGEEALYDSFNFVIATTHQLLRFSHWFDLLVVDEVDSFPLYENEILNFALERARKKEGLNLFLTATLTEQLKEEVRAEKLEKILVAVRYHGYLLPVPKMKRLNKWHRLANAQYPLNNVLKKKLDSSLANKKQLLIFCPSIRLVESVYLRLKTSYPKVEIEFAHSKDKLREKKVLKMRTESCQWLICTTILERGVTFKGVDVVIIGANHPVFNEASLVQIAGRSGRSAESPLGNVVFLHDGWSKAMKLCLKTIRKMNQQASKEMR